MPMPRYESLGDDLIEVPLAVGQVRLTNADVEVEVEKIEGGMVHLKYVDRDPPGGFRSAESYIQRKTKFLRGADPP